MCSTCDEIDLFYCQADYTGDELADLLDSFNEYITQIRNLSKKEEPKDYFYVDDKKHKIA